MPQKVEDAVAKVLWISSAPRTGSMWTFNVCRELLAKNYFEVLPTTVPQSDAEMAENYKKAMNENRSHRYYCLKIHNILNDNLRNSKIITTIRDPREIVHSFHRFMQCDFERAVSAGTAVHKYVLAYKKFQSPVLFVRYEDMLDEPMNTIREIDAFLELRTCERAMSEINQKFSKQRVNAIVDKVTKTLQRDLNSGVSVKSERMVALPNQRVRAFDIATGFQTGHIAGPNDGNWRTAYSLTQKNYMFSALSEICSELGYSEN